MQFRGHVGPVGAPVPTIFEKESVSSQMNFHKNDTENITDVAMSWQKSKIKHPQFKISNDAPELLT